METKYIAVLGGNPDDQTWISTWAIKVDYAVGIDLDEVKGRTIAKLLEDGYRNEEEVQEMMNETTHFWVIEENLYDAVMVSCLGGDSDYATQACDRFIHNLFDRLSLKKVMK